MSAPKPNRDPCGPQLSQSIHRVRRGQRGIAQIGPTRIAGAHLRETPREAPQGMCQHFLLILIPLTPAGIFTEIIQAGGQYWEILVARRLSNGESETKGEAPDIELVRNHSARSARLRTLSVLPACAAVLY